jgi:hypothetical protein
VDTPSNKSAINTLEALCTILPASSGTLFHTIRRYATFAPGYNLVTSIVTRDKAVRKIRITKIKE